MLKYKIRDKKCIVQLKDGNQLVGQYFDGLKGYLFDNCPFIDSTGYKYCSIKRLDATDIPNNFNFEIMNCFCNKCEAPMDQVPYPISAVMFSKENGSLNVQFQLISDDDDEWQDRVKWVYGVYIKELQNQISIINDVDFYVVNWPNGYSYYIKVRGANFGTLDEAFNKSVPRIKKFFLETEQALSGIDRFNKAINFWGENKIGDDEKKWHDFFNNFSWILSQCFSAPFFLLNDKAYVGGKGINNNNGNILDFIYKNNLLENIALIEIKTPQTALIGQEYRKNIYSISSELTGAIDQLLNYKDQLQKEYYASRVNSNINYYSLNPKCILIAGTLGDLDEAKKITFELFRSELRTVELVTYDELFGKVELIKDIMLPL